MRPSSILLVVSTLGLQACKSCAQFNPPDANQDDPDDTDDTDDTEDPDTAEDTGPIDTNPPPPCDYPEEEVNDLYSQAQEMGLDAWACGALSTEGDQDTMWFEVPYEGWYRVWVRAADFGSYADIQLILTDDEEDYSAIQTNSPGSTDPRIVAYFPEAGRWYATVQEQQGGYGDQHEWELMVSESKVPVDWDLEETESNNAVTDANLLENGQRVYGVISGSTDRDWFKFEIPEGKTNFTATIDAWNYGSPFDSKISLYSSEVLEDSEANPIATSDRGSNSQDQDSVLEQSITEADTFHMLVKFDDGEGAGGLYWYVLQVDWDTTPID